MNVTCKTFLTIADEEASMSKEIKRVLFVLMPNNFQDSEFLEPYTIISNDGHNVDVAGLANNAPAVGVNGYQHKPNKVLMEMSTQDFDDYDALVIPGGPASTQYLWDNEDIQDVVRYFYENEKIVATICYACIVPVQAGVLTGRHATVYPTDEAKALLKDNDVVFVDEECVVLPHERIITARGPKAASTFGNAIVNLLSSSKI